MLPTEVTEAFPQGLVFLGYRGSHAHGTYVPPEDPTGIDDIDLIGAYVEPLQEYLGLPHGLHHGTKDIWVGSYDMVFYELRFLCHLLAGCNPNVLSTLWLPEKHEMVVLEPWDIIKRQRHLFASQAAYGSFVGYAHGQLEKMQKFSTQGYMGQKRKALVEKFGYDCKNAAHCIRLLRMGIEFLHTGELLVERPDAQELLAIKRGEWSIERVKKLAGDLIEMAKAARDESPLPREVDRAAINAVLCEAMTRALNINQTERW